MHEAAWNPPIPRIWNSVGKPWRIKWAFTLLHTWIVDGPDLHIPKYVDDVIDRW